MSPIETGLMRSAESHEARAGKSSAPHHPKDRTKQDAPRRPCAGRDPCHPIPIGESVSIVSLIGKNPPFLEGHAVIQAAAQGRHRYRVQFLGDPIVKERFVLPEFQCEHARVLAMLIDVWRVAIEVEANLDDFFPDDL